MEMTKLEVVAVETSIDETVEVQMRELSELQLALVGGGIGEVIVA